VGPEEGHKNDPRDGTPLLWGKAERGGAVQRGEEKAPGETWLWPFSTSRGHVRKMDKDYLPRPEATGQGVTVLNWKRVGLDSTEGRNFLKWGLWGTGTGCPEKLCMSHHWKCSRPGWMGLWVTCSTGRCPCSWQEVWISWPLKVPSNSNHSMIQWFCDTSGCQKQRQNS